MKRILLTSAAFAFIAASQLVTQAASAQQLMGAADYYLALRMGAAQIEDTKFDTTAGATSVANSYQSGGNISAAFGRTFGQGAIFSPRGEFEVGVQSADVDSHTSTTGGVATSFAAAAAEGSTTTTYGFANLYGDVAVAPRTKLFAGGGVGMGRTKFDAHEAAGVTLMEDDSTTFGYQGTVGLSYQLTNRFALEGSYRYQRFTDVELTSTDSTNSAIDLDSNLFQGGIRLSF